MESNVKVTFWLYSAKKNSLNLIPIYMRVSYDYDHFTMSTGIQVRVHEWDKKAMRIRGATAEVFALNAQMDSIKLKVLQIVNQLTVLGKPFNINTIKKMLEGNETTQITLMRICDEQISEMQKLRGKSYAPTTITKYKNTVLRLKQFLKYKYKRSDIFLYELNYYFISEFETFLRHKYDNSTTTCYKHYQRLTRIIHQAMHRGKVLPSFRPQVNKYKFSYDDVFQC